MEYWMIETGTEPEAGIDGGMSRRGGGGANMNTIGVESLDASIAKVTASGGKIVGLKMAIPGVGWFAACTDPEAQREVA